MTNTAAPPPPLFHPDDLKAPGLGRLLLEGRAPWELAALLASTPWWTMQPPPAGDGHPVLVLPGLGANDFTTVPLRRFLRQRGYSPYPWRQGFNFGPNRGSDGGVLEACRSVLRHTAERHGQPVSLVGWSLGGVYARELAKQMPAQVRCVITLGSPFAGHPRATNAWRFFEMVSGQSVHDEALIAELQRPPPVPTTSIYSKSDGIVAWQCCLNDEASHAQTENIEVRASHLGMGANPVALYAIADRLAQPPGQWQRFARSGRRRWFYPAA